MFISSEKVDLQRKTIMKMNTNEMFINCHINYKSSYENNYFTFLIPSVHDPLILKTLLKFALHQITFLFTIVSVIVSSLIRPF